MIILDLLFLAFILVVVIFPFWIFWNIWMSRNASTRITRNAGNHILGRFIIGCILLLFKCVVAFAIAIAFIDVLKIIMLPVDQWNGPLSFLPLIKPLFSH